MLLQNLYEHGSANGALTDVEVTHGHKYTPTPWQMLDFQLCVDNDLDDSFLLVPGGLNGHYFQK